MDYTVYSHPEKYGLTLVESRNRGEAYSFDMFIIWHDSRGVAYWGQDAGCSCPTPFEGQGLDTLAQGTLEDAFRAASEWERKR